MVFELGQLPSRCPDDRFRAANRLDPYWDGVWDVGSHAQWVSAARLRKQQAAHAGWVRPSRMWPTDEGWAFEKLHPSRPMWQRALTVLGVLDSWRTLTFEQLAFVSGVPEVVSERCPLVQVLFAAGLIEVGTSLPAIGRRPERRQMMVRLARTSVFRKRLEPLMTRQEWLSVTGGVRLQAERFYDRHNVLASEVLARAAEFTTVSGVCGEKLATHDVLGWIPAGRPVPVHGEGRSADGLLLRGDGVRVAVEVTATTGASFEKKVASWARLLHECRFEDTGLVVVVLVASNKALSRGPGSKQHLHVARKTITKVTSRIRGVPEDPVARRLLVADWEDWFPSSGAVSRKFLTLRAEYSPGPLSDGMWPELSLMSARDVPAPTNEVLRGFEGRLAGLRQTVPHLASGVPTYPFVGYRLGAGTGDAAGRVQLPARLLPHR